MQPLYLVKTLVAASANNIAQSQGPVTGAFTLNGTTVSGGVATLDTQRRVIITSAGNDSGITFTVTGTGQDRSSFSETIAGTNAGVAATTQDFLTVTKIVSSAATASTVTAGTNTVGSSPWKMMNWNAFPINLGIGVLVSGTVNYTIEYTYDDIQGVYQNPSATFPTVFSLTALAAQTATKDGNITTPISAVRLTVNSGTGTATATIIQSGMGPA